jgi:hypothetical protein
MGRGKRENDFPSFYGSYREGESFSLRIYAIAKGKTIFPPDMRCIWRYEPWEEGKEAFPFCLWHLSCRCLRSTSMKRWHGIWSGSADFIPCSGRARISAALRLCFGRRRGSSLARALPPTAGLDAEGGQSLVARAGMLLQGPTPLPRRGRALFWGRDPRTPLVAGVAHGVCSCWVVPERS